MKDFISTRQDVLEGLQGLFAQLKRLQERVPLEREDHEYVRRAKLAVAKIYGEAYTRYMEVKNAA